MIPSQMENKKKRVVVQNIRDKKGDRFDQYKEEFEYLISSGISLAVNAITNPHFPLSESLQKNLLTRSFAHMGISSTITTTASRARWTIWLTTTPR